MNILLVDDEPAYRLLMGDYLEDQGWKVLTATDGEDALKVLATSAVDCIVSDVYMPVMDGLKFYHAVREIDKYKTLPFLFVSAFDDLHTLTATGTSKNSAFLKKSRPPADLKAWIVYLTTPANKRPLTPPIASVPPPGRNDRTRESVRAPRRTI